jgi:hypothetical protein
MNTNSAILCRKRILDHSSKNGDPRLAASSLSSKFKVLLDDFIGAELATHGAGVCI